MPTVTKGDIQRLDLDSIKLDGTTVTATGAELNFVDTTAGTAAASKAAVLDANKKIGQMNIDHTVQTAATSSTGTTLNSWGVINITSTATKNFVLSAPRAGAVVDIVKTGGSTLVSTLTLASGNFGATGATNKLNFNGALDAVRIVGVSTARYLIVSNIGSVTATT